MEGRHRTGQGQCTSDSMKEGEGQRAAYSYQLFKHIPPHTETLQSEDKKKKNTPTERLKSGKSTLGEYKDCMNEKETIKCGIS